ncbi:MAG: hypothetical protein GYA24_12745 [Candidatus Lokiarchaeota archaeon]|nr:hypothetical protein [Candidatus Lokiarchaeota archaeon]
MKVFFDDGEYDTEDPVDSIYITAKRNTAKYCSRFIRGSTHLAAFSPDSKKIAIADRESGPRIDLFDLETLEITSTFVTISTEKTDHKTKGLRNSFRAIVFSQDGRNLYALDSYGYLHAWSVNDNERLWGTKCDLPCDSASSSGRLVSVADNVKLLVCGISIYNSDTGELKTNLIKDVGITYETDIYHVSLSPDGSKYAIGFLESGHPSVTIVDIFSKKVHSSFIFEKPQSLERYNIRQLEFSPNRDSLLVVKDTGCNLIKLSSTGDSEENRFFAMDDLTLLKGARFLRDSDQIVVLHEDGLIETRYIDILDRVAIEKGSPFPYVSMSDSHMFEVSPDTFWIITSNNREIRLDHIN